MRGMCLVGCARLQGESSCTGGCLCGVRSRLRSCRGQRRRRHPLSQRQSGRCQSRLRQGRRSRRAPTSVGRAAREGGRVPPLLLQRELLRLQSRGRVEGSRRGHARRGLGNRGGARVRRRPTKPSSGKKCSPASRVGDDPPCLVPGWRRGRARVSIGRRAAATGPIGVSSRAGRGSRRHPRRRRGPGLS